MNIIETDIPDEIVENIDYSKIELAENVIKNIQPLIDQLITGQNSDIKLLENELKEKRKIVHKKKTSLESMFSIYKKKQKIQKLLERVNKLVNSGLINEGQSRQEMIVLLKIVDSLSEEKLNYHLKNTMNIITKRFDYET